MHERDECVRRRCSHELRPSDHGSVGCACTNQAEIFDLDFLWINVAEALRRGDRRVNRLMRRGASPRPS